mmetsp:Transcript_100820/g.285501  ORF Transcript_100820/g.285501 Transcript_100820/m.285501 type:complete len:333 (-) Transcript_100820:230-1228(-)
MCSRLAMSLKVKNTFIVVDEQPIEDAAAAGLRKTQSLPNSPRLRSSAKVDSSDATSVDDIESSKGTGYDTQDEFLESQSEFGLSWSDGHGAPGELPPHTRSSSPEDAPSYTGADPCAWQGWMIPSLVPLHMHGLGDGLYALMPAAQEAQAPTAWEGEITLMMRNVPKKLTQHALLEEINSNGFAGTYDFVYLPMDQDSKVNRGYCFINFMDPAHAVAFKACYEGRQFHQYNSRKLIAILPAVLQGFEANRAQFSTVRALREDPCARPLFLREPQVVTKAGPASASTDGSETSVGPGGPAVNFCPYCGGDAKKEFKFCQYCGKTLSLCSTPLP